MIDVKNIVSKIKVLFAGKEEVSPLDLYKALDADVRQRQHEIDTLHQIYETTIADYQSQLAACDDLINKGEGEDFNLKLKQKIQDKIVKFEEEHIADLYVKRQELLPLEQQRMEIEKGIHDTISKREVVNEEKSSDNSTSNNTDDE